MRSLPALLSPSADVILTEMSDGTGVLLNMRTKFYYVLNETGVFVWKKLEKGASDGLERIAEALHADFGVEVAQAQADIHRVLEEMLDEELVVP